MSGSSMLDTPSPPPPPLRAHAYGLAAGALLAPVLTFLGALVVDGEGIGRLAPAITEALGLAFVVFVTGAVSALPLSVVVERLWPRPRRWYSAALAYAVLGGGYAFVAQALLLGWVSWRLVLLGVIGAVIARAAGGRVRPAGGRRRAVWSEDFDGATAGRGRP